MMIPKLGKKMPMMIGLMTFTVLSIFGLEVFIHNRFLNRDNTMSILAQTKNIIYPNSFKLIQDKLGLVHHYNVYFNEHLTPEELSQYNVLKYNGKVDWLTKDIINVPYHLKQLEVFEPIPNQEEKDDCSRNKNNLNIFISAYTEFDHELDEMLQVFKSQMINDTSFKELQPFFTIDVGNQLKAGTAPRHWYKFAGSSVWLKDLGVHLMISRVLYSIVGNKRKPVLSLTYAQIYDENWKELKDTELVVPTKNELDETTYQSIKFPKFLPIPFYHDVDNTNQIFYGTEDPRLFLTTNQQGEEEPMIIFNSHHRKITKQELIDKENVNVKFKAYRSMFLAWPFRYQVGKSNVDGLSDSRYNQVIYNKVVELRRSDVPRLSVQKNWTPLLNYHERQRYGYDKNIYFVYRWSNMEILKCNLDNFVEGSSFCSYDYKRKIDSSGDEVGPLRGGTEMINIRDIIPPEKHHKYNLPEKEIWIGFPRAHLKKCGCGSDMYRPNLAVISKEGDDKYKLTQLSSFTSLDIEVYGWTNFKILCASRDPNALIPNGISGWKFYKDSDYLTLSLSVADATNHIIHIKDLLVNVLKSTNALKLEPNSGYNEVIVDCAMDSSDAFCKDFGREMVLANKVPPPEPEY